MLVRGLLLGALLVAGAGAEGPYLGTGIKIGEVTSTEAIVWLRTTSRAERVGPEGGLPTVRYTDPKTGKLLEKAKDRPDASPTVSFPEGATVASLEGAVPGAAGRARVRYRVAGDEAWQETAWQATDPNRDFTLHVSLSGLKAGAQYELQAEVAAADGDTPTAVLPGRFRTAPAADQAVPVDFMVITCQEYDDRDLPERGFKVYPTMLAMDPDFMVHTGDILYYDKLAKTLPLARWEWAQMFSLETNRDFHTKVASYFMKDDHDTWMNDCWPTMQTRFMGDFTFAEGQAVFLEQVPMGEKTYRTVRWGKDLQIWMVEGRDFRSPNTMKDGPDKSIWGAEQKAWFKRTVQESDATFRLLISPTPLIGPDRKLKNDNHANAGFVHEGRELREFLAGQKNMAVICGDRHWQCASVDGETGLHEYFCGPNSDAHAGGWKLEDRLPEHRYLNVIGGFLSVSVAREGGVPTCTFRHHSVDGEVMFEDVLR